jgi:hypothetical protein
VNIHKIPGRPSVKGKALIEAMSGALSAITPGDAAGWFGHCGYEVEVQYV